MASLEGFLIALFCGTLVGVERELGKAETEPEAAGMDPLAQRAEINPAGIRTHVLVALLGALITVLDVGLHSQPVLTVCGLVVTGAAMATSYAIRARLTGSYGTTSVFTLLLTYVMGSLAQTGLHSEAATAAVAVTTILAVKVPIHRFIHALTRAEVAAALKLALVSIVVLPMLPNRDLAVADWPWLAARLDDLGWRGGELEKALTINPFKLWLLVAVISGIGFVGYVLIRVLGARRGLPLTGLVGGLVSSTAVSVSMAQASRAHPATATPFVAAILWASAVMAVRVLLLVLALAPRLFLTLALPMGALLLICSGAAAWYTLGAHGARGATPTDKLTLKTPFALMPALKLTSFIFAVGILARLARHALGESGLVLTAAASGLADVDAITVSVAQQSRGEGGVSAVVAVTAILTAVASNTVTKGVMVLSLGSRRVGRLTMTWLIGGLVATGAVHALQSWLS